MCKIRFIAIMIASLLVFVSCGKSLNNEITSAIKSQDIVKLQQYVNTQLDTNFKDKDGKTLLELAMDTQNNAIINFIEFGLNYNVFHELEGKWKLAETKNWSTHIYCLDFKIDKAKSVLLGQWFFLKPSTNKEDREFNWSKVRFKDNKYINNVNIQGHTIAVFIIEKVDGKWYAFFNDRMFNNKSFKKYTMVKF